MAILGSGARTALLTNSVAATATQLCADDSNRKRFFFQNNDASVAIYLGGSSVSATAGQHLVKVGAGESFTDSASKEAWYGISASGTITATTGYTVT